MSEAVDNEKRNFDPYAIPMDGKFNVADGFLFEADEQWKWFERLRNEAPVHFCEESEYGPYWSVTKFEDIMHVDKNHGIYS